MDWLTVRKVEGLIWPGIFNKSLINASSANDMVWMTVSRALPVCSVRWCSEPMSSVKRLVSLWFLMKECRQRRMPLSASGADSMICLSSWLSTSNLMVVEFSRRGIRSAAGWGLRIFGWAISMSEEVAGSGAGAGGVSRRSEREGGVGGSSWGAATGGGSGKAMGASVATGARAGSWMGAGALGICNRSDVNSSMRRCASFNWMAASAEAICRALRSRRMAAI